MSAADGSSSTANRAKRSFSKAPNGRRLLRGSAMPGTAFMRSRVCRTLSSWPVASGAITMKWPCGVTVLELQAKIDQTRPVPVNLAQIKVGTNQPNLISNPMRHHRGVRIIKHDAFLAVEPAGLLVDLGDNRLDAEHQDLVLQETLLGVEHLALPAEQIDDFRDTRRVHRPGRDDGRALGRAIGDVARRTRLKQVVQLRLRHAQ